MKSYVKLLIKQLTIAAIFLSCVTVVSFGIRQVRFSLHRANTLKNPVVADIEPEPILTESDTVDIETKPEYVEATEPDEEAPLKDYSDVKPTKGDYAKAKAFKKNFAKAKGSKELEKISLSDYENLYRTKEGQLWYVNKQSDGKTVKMLVHVDEATGEMMLVDAKSGGSKNLQKISLGDYDNLYITESGEQWYVSDNPDGSGSKSRVKIDDTTGEITVLEDYSDNGKERETKD